MLSQLKVSPTQRVQVLYSWDTLFSPAVVQHILMQRQCESGNTVPHPQIAPWLRDVSK